MRNFIYLILIGFIFSGCRNYDLIHYNTKQNIKILNVNFDKFDYQIVFKFMTKKRKIGFLLIDKKEKNIIEFLEIQRRDFFKVKLCQVNSIRIVEDLHLKRNRIGLVYYENDKFKADFDNDSKEKYYTICHKQLNNIKNGLQRRSS